MYVCLCNGYRDVEIREVAESGLRCVKEVYLTLGNGPCCGGCLDFAKDIVKLVNGDGGSGVGTESQERSEAGHGAAAVPLAAESARSKGSEERRGGQESGWLC